MSLRNPHVCLLNISTRTRPFTDHPDLSSPGDTFSYRASYRNRRSSDFAKSQFICPTFSGAVKNKFNEITPEHNLADARQALSRFEKETIEKAVPPPHLPPVTVQPPANNNPIILGPALSLNGQVLDLENFDWENFNWENI
jgi:hypothetical protein